MTTHTSELMAAASTQEPRPRASAARHVTSLDGLRALAVAAVMLYHAGAPMSSMGFLGVDLFFVLSGFLITNLLAREFAANGRVSLPKFWGRRFLRLMPAYWLYAGFLTIAILGVGWGWTRENQGWTPGLFVASIWGYFLNLAPRYGEIWEHQSLTMHLWSLSVEEQYYFIWPAVCALLFRTRWLSSVAWTLVAVILVRRHFADNEQLVTLLSTRGFGIMLGSALALTLGDDPRPNVRRWLASPAFRWSIVGATIAFIITASALRQTEQINAVFAYRWFVPLFCILFAALTAILWYGPRDRLATALSWAPLVYVGKISYGVYLYHELARFLTWNVLLVGLDAWPKELRYSLRLAVFFALTFAIASLSYHFLEKPFLSLKTRLR